MTYKQPGGGLRTVSCVVCGSPANFVHQDVFEGAYYDCVRCGDFAVTSAAIDEFAATLTDAKRRALASYLIRKMQGPSRPKLRSDFFQSLVARSLPYPDEMTDNLLLWLAGQADGRPGAQISIYFNDEPLRGIVGAVDAADIEWTALNLVALGLVGGKTLPGACHVATVTGDGWRRVEALKSARVASRYAVFARHFRNADLDKVSDLCLAPAVEKTGFELRPVTQRSGLIDATTEDEIRRCRFVIADLSDDDAVAYWEAGFAEGLGKPVIYVCREKDADDPGAETKTRFDAEHRHLVRWSPEPETFAATAKKLEAVIRNTLLGEATQDD